MLSWLTGGGAPRKTATELYGVVVTAARMPVLYARFGVPDSREGRYEMVVLHLALLLERLHAEGEATVPLQRALIETFVTDMDDCMRELGVGDLTVPGKVKSAAAGLYARADAIRTALAADAPDAALGAAIGALMLGSDGRDPRAGALAAYAREAAATLRRADRADLMAGRIAFPDPERFTTGSPT
jgi:cytochrome b pre-mRNA-processing protein 3